MTTEQRKLMVNVSNRLLNTKAMIKQQLQNELERTYSALSKGVVSNGIAVTPEDLKIPLGDEIFANLQQDANKLREFLKDF